jgi:DNA-binding FrmR family transcriptional regulator
MAHTIRENETLLALARGLHAQLQALERALEQEKGCAEVLHLLEAAQDAMNGLVAEAIQDYIRRHIVDPSREQNDETRAKAL